MAPCTLYTCYHPNLETRRQIDLLGQYFHPCCWTRCVISEEPSHECSGPSSTTSCWHSLHQTKLQSVGHFRFRASLNPSRSKKLERVHLSYGVSCSHNNLNLYTCHSLAAMLENKEFCHLHFNPRLVLFLCDSYVEYQLSRHLCDGSNQSRITMACARSCLLPVSSVPVLRSALHVGHKTGKRRDSICDTMSERTHSLQNECPQGSMRAIDSSGSVSMHTPQSNTCCAAAASSARSAASIRSSSSNWNCSMAANSALEEGAASRRGSQDGPP